MDTLNVLQRQSAAEKAFTQPGREPSSSSSASLPISVGVPVNGYHQNTGANKVLWVIIGTLTLHK